MKTTPTLPFLLCGFLPALALAQEPFTAAGPSPQAARTLAEVEPRTIVNATNTPGDGQNTFIISKRGSYYLTRNLTGAAGKNGISIRADDVTLDLNGFALVSGPGAGLRGINVPAQQSNLCVRNGTVRGWTGGGVQAELGRAALAEKLRLTGNTGAVGIYVGIGSLIKDSVANGNGVGFQTGDRCQVMNCISTENSGAGFRSTSYVTLLDCTSSRNGGKGFDLLSANSILRCSATRNEGEGISASQDCTVTDSTGSLNGLTEILVFDSTITNCTASANKGTGIFTPRSTVTNCNTRGNGDDGILANDGVVAFCKASGNNQNNINGTQDISAPGSTRTGNNPAP